MMAASQNTRFKNEPSGIDRRAVGGHAELSAGRINGGGLVGKIATRMKGEKITPGNNLSPIFSSHNAAKAEFSAVICEFGNGDLSVIADCSKDTVKCWKARRAFPGGENLMELARPDGNPNVRRWVAVKLGFIDPEIMEAMMAAAYQVGHQNNPDGEAMRAAMARAARKRLR